MLTASLLFLGHSLTFLYAQQNLKSSSPSTSEQHWTNADYEQAENLRLAGKEAEARPYYEKAIAAAEKEKLWEMYLLSQAYLAGSYAGTPDYQTGINIASSALEQLETLPYQEQKHAFRLYLSLSNLHRLSFRSRAFVEFNQKALDLVLAHYPDQPHPFLAEAYFHIGKGYYTLSQLDQAMTYFNKAAAILEELPKKDVIALRPGIFSFIGALNARIGELETAAIYLEQALEFALIASQGKEDNLAEYYQDIGRVYSQLNEHEKSIDYYKKAIYLLENQEVQDSRTLYVNMPMNYLSIAESHSSIQDYDSALHYCEKAIALIEKGGNQTPPFISLYTYLHLGKVYFRKSELDQALSFAQKAEQLYSAYEAMMSRNKVFKALSLQIDFLYAMAYTRMDSLDQALGHLRTIQKALAQKTADERKDFLGITSNTLTTLAEVHLRKSQLDSALFYNQLAIIDACQGFDNPSYRELPQMEDCEKNPQIFFILNQKAELLLQLAESKENSAEKLAALEVGLATIDLVDEVYEKNMKKINVLRGGQSAALIRLAFEPLQTGMVLAAEHHRISNAVAPIQKSFHYNQKIKAQQLWLSLLQSEAKQFGGLDPAILQAEQTLMSDIAKTEKQIEVALSQEKLEEASTLKNDQLFRQQKEYIALQRKLEKQYPDYYASKYAFVPEDGKSLQALLSKEEVLIEYAFKDSTLFVYTLTKDTPLQLKTVPLDTATLQQMEQFQEPVKQSSMIRKSSREKFIRLSHQLYQQFIAPAEDLLQGKSKLVIIGDRVTNYIPFETLLASAEGGKFSQLDFLIKSFEISYHYSATLLAKARRKAKVATAGVYAFAPVYDQAEEEKFTARGVATTSPVPKLEALDERGQYQQLPESENEVKAIIQLFQDNDIEGNMLALREAANEERLKENLRRPYQFIHIAGHSFANLTNPKFSGIACYENKADQTEDNILYTGEIYNLATKADLVTLSSCESGFGKLALTEGMLGLNRAFINAGTPNVIFSLWKVYDKVSAQLMIEFYQGVLAGKSYSTSLREAKLKLLAQESTATPHFWSPYILIGR